VVAEGVETEPQRNHLVDQGCDILQGYLFSRPLPAREIPDFVSRQRDISAPSAT
jgi:EAL domain-containing protein (putative c-di-GMP-specific phosphodiesterase class I)